MTSNSKERKVFPHGPEGESPASVNAGVEDETIPERLCIPHLDKRQEGARNDISTLPSFGPSSSSELGNTFPILNNEINDEYQKTMKSILQSRREDEAVPGVQIDTRPHIHDSVKEVLTCPISHDIVKDPVILISSGKTYNRESLCLWLLKNPTLCPYTRKGPGEKLQYIDNLFIRQTLVETLGEKAFQPYDDSDFREQYAAIGS